MHIILILSLAVDIFSHKIAISADHIYPDSIQINATRVFNNLPVAVGETIKAHFSLTNQESDSLINFYYSEFVPPEFRVITDSVLLNGESFTQYIYEHNSSDSVYDDMHSHRWIIENPDTTTGIYPIVESVDIYYSLKKNSTGPSIFPGYSWTGKLSSQNSGTITFGYNDTVDVSVVPVELATFEIILINGNVELKWTTVSESNNYGFEIQRSTDKINFRKIGFLDGSGTTTSPRYYIFVDNTVRSGRYYYRLKQIDTDGAFEYSNILEINAANPETISLKQNYPNPFNLQTIIRYQIPDKSHVTLELFNLLGQKVCTLVNKVQEENAYTYIWNGKDNSGKLLESGVYIYKLTAGNTMCCRKLILLK